VAPVLSTVFGLAVCVGAHALLIRMLPGLLRLKVAVCSFIVGLCGSAGSLFAFLVPAESLSMSDTIGYAVLSLVSYLGLCYCYFFAFYNVGESARRIRLLIELDAAGEDGMTLEEILASYNARMIVEARLGRLLASGQIAQVDDRYFMAGRLLLYVAKAMIFLKLILFGSTSELRAVR